MSRTLFGNKTSYLIKQKQWNLSHYFTRSLASAISLSDQDALYQVLQKHFDAFFEDIYCEMVDKYGPIEELNVCENLGDHLIGKVELTSSL